MTLVNIETGELASISEADARRLTQRIRLLSGSVAESVEKLSALISEAQASGAHVALGYRSWTEYVAAEFSGSPLRLDRGDRRELVVSLSAQGMSTRAIAPVVGASQKTVDRDVRESSDSRPEPEIVDAEIVEDDEPTPVRGPITGIDGKTYSPPAPRTPARRPLTDVARDLGQDLRKITDRAERLRDDDRFARNKNEVAAHLRHHLAQALKVLADLEQEINSQEERTND